MSFVTFIIPTVGRPTLARTLASLLEQSDQDWNAIVVVDRVDHFKLSTSDPRIHVLKLQEKFGAGHFSGHVRNYGLPFSSGKWTGFVDDDDRLDRNYVHWLREESDGQDLFIFKMKYAPKREDNVLLLPRSTDIRGLKAAEVGISFAVRKAFQQKHDIWFPSEEFEDWIFISQCLQAKAKCKISERVAYYIRH